MTVGSRLDATFASDTVGGQATFANVALGEAAAHVNSPVTGVIVRWRVLQASGGPFTLRVLAPAGGGTYAGARTSSPQTPTSASVQTFSTSLPISAGDTIGLDNTNSTDHIGEVGSADSVWVDWLPQLQDGVAARRPPSATQTGESVKLGPKHKRRHH